MEANKEREHYLKGNNLLTFSPSPSHSYVGDISKMCAHCTLSLCCHNKPNPTRASITRHVSPFYRGPIACLAVVEFSVPQSSRSQEVKELQSGKQ
ncbi:hypothetical protein SAY86_027347 [Trapa natans]|uniref:Uncharacterized protein n=1 Tax=Trapa natans TaxID=22666 RepID=A0AAN7KM83_TRANT|nr:hypothetical protein SAY86_027347 [Trapa natans]